MKIAIRTQDKDALLRAVHNASFNIQIHEADEPGLLHAYIMDSRNRELTLTESFWLGSVFRCEVQEDLRKENEAMTEPLKAAWRL